MHKHADVLEIVHATRPAQTAERVRNALNLKRTRAGLSAVSLATVRASLTKLHETYNVVRLTGDDAAACGAFPHQYSPRTAFWISTENYHSYHPNAELPTVRQPQPEQPDTTPAAT